MLLDEADTYLSLRHSQQGQHEDLRALVNAGHRRGAVAYRCEVGKAVTVKEYPAFAPLAIAGIGDIPDTVLDRAVVISMKRRAPSEHVEPFRLRVAGRQLRPLHDELDQWADAAVDHLSTAWPTLPPELVDRAADVWEPLVAIADLAGADWGERARHAAVTLNRARQQRDPSLGVRLLNDCRQVFAGADQLATDELLALLVALEDSPWGDLYGKPLDARGLARRLRPYDVRSKQVRTSERAGVKGYARTAFVDAWQRYLPALDEPEPSEMVDVDEYEASYPDLFTASEEEF